MGVIPSPFNRTILKCRGESIRPCYNGRFSSPETSPLEVASYDFGQRCVHAVRFEGALRGRDHHLFLGPTLRTHGAQRLGQVDVHEAADGRTATAAWVGDSPA